MRGAKETSCNALLLYCANISNFFNIVNIRVIDNFKYWQYPYNWQIQILTISTKLYQCLILTRWASLIPFSHQQVPAKVNNIKVKTCKSCKYLNDAENLFVIVIVLALFLLLQTLDPVVLAEPFKGQSQEIRYNGRLRHWCFHMKTNLYSSTQLNTLSDAVNHYSPKISTTTMNKTVAEP